jgi:hypothetical protein
MAAPPGVKPPGNVLPAHAIESVRRTLVEINPLAIENHKFGTATEEVDRRRVT